jgi:hypothetical protein
VLAMTARPRQEIPVNVWIKGRAIPNYDAGTWRRDDFGAVIRFYDYGNRSSEYGWEVDPILPAAMGGSGDISNLRPLHYRINAGLGGVLGGTR